MAHPNKKGVQKLGRIAWKDYSGDDFGKHVSSRVGEIFGNGRSAATNAAKKIGIEPQTLRNHEASKYSTVSVKQLRSYIRVLNLDLVMVLKLLGYTEKEIIATAKKLSA